MPGRERHSLHLHAATKAGVDEILRPCLSASASQKRQFTVVRLLGRSRSEGARELTSDLVHEAGVGSRDQEAQQAELSELDTVCDAEARRGRGGELQEPRAVRQIQEPAPGHHPTRRPHPAPRVPGGDGGGGRGDEGSVRAAHLCSNRRQGSKLFVLLRNGVNSLNVVSATSLVMFKVNINIFQCCCG